MALVAFCKVASPFVFPGRNMMLKASVPPARITVKRLAVWTIILFPIVFIPLSLWFWVESRIPDWYYWKAELFFLLAAEVWGLDSRTCSFLRNLRLEADSRPHSFDRTLSRVGGTICFDRRCRAHGSYRC